jgi:hypothetical protein
VQKPWLLGESFARDCQTYKHEVIQASKEKSKGGHLKKGKDGADDDNQDGYPNIKGVMIIFKCPQAYEDCNREKVT